MSMILNKIFKIVFVIFLIESILILIGIKCKIISYGIEVATPITEIIILLSLTILAGLRYSWTYYSDKYKIIFSVIYSLVMLLLGISYILDSGFVINLHGL